MKARIQKAQKLVAAADLDCYLVTHLPHIRYLCGFSGSNAMLLIGRRGADFFTDSRYAEQIRSEVKGARKHVPPGGNLVGSIAELPIMKKGYPRIGIQPRHMTVAAHAALGKQLGGALLVSHDHLIDSLTLVKDKSEIENIRKVPTSTPRRTAG